MKIIPYFLLVFLISTIPSCKEEKKETIPAKKIEAVRGVWLTNVDSKVLDSQENIVKAVELCSDLGINTICAVVWNKGMTLYPSKELKKLIGIEIDPRFEGRDPLKELIDEAHKKNIKVIAWFEFGFASSFKENGGRLLEVRPGWAGKDTSGNLVTKNGFEWMNAFHPEVQSFLLSLIMEVVKNYEVDGIQGDDRLPAMPSEGGYDDYTVKLYKDWKGEAPPRDHKDSAWVQWRADLLTDYMKRIYNSVKAEDPNCLVSMAPSIYPWSKEEYLQDWPKWLENNYVDFISPQVYRYDIEKYRTALSEIVDEQVTKENLEKIYPGVLLKVGKYQPDIKFLMEMIRANREKGFMGEIFFFYEGVKKYPNIFKDSIYINSSSFPKF